jgi:hypothetical protein
MDRQIIEEFVACSGRLRQAMAGLSQDESTCRPGPGDWSILELVIHLADSDGIAIDRMKRMLTEDEPPLLYADETAYVRQLATHEQSLEDALILFEVGRRQFARVLRALPDEAFERRGLVPLSKRLPFSSALIEFTLVVTRKLSSRNPCGILCAARKPGKRSNVQELSQEHC